MYRPAGSAALAVSPTAHHGSRQYRRGWPRSLRCARRWRMVWRASLIRCRYRAPRLQVVVGYSTGSADGARPDETRAITSALLRCQ